MLVNANLPYTAEPAPLLDTADEATGQQLEAEAHEVSQYGRRRAGGWGQPDPCGRLSGYAADILAADIRMETSGHRFCRDPRLRVAHSLRRGYGFILRYPQDRQAATGMVLSRGTGGMWAWKTPLPSVPAA